MHYADSENLETCLSDKSGLKSVILAVRNIGGQKYWRWINRLNVTLSPRNYVNDMHII